MKRYCNVCIYETLPFEEKELSKNRILFHEGERIHHVYHIDQGYIKVLKYYESGDEKIFDILGPGDFLGLLLVLQDQKEYIVTAIAMTDVLIREIQVEQVKESYQKNTLFQQTCLRCATGRANVFQNQLYQITASDVDEKIMGVLMYLYHKFGNYKEGIHILYLPITQTELASIIGIRRETLSRRFKYLQDQGAFTLNNHEYQFKKT